MNPPEIWSLRAATGEDRAGTAALLARSLSFDISDGPFRLVDTEALTAAVWSPPAPGDGPAAAVVRLVSHAAAGLLPGPDGVAVRVPAGIAVGSVGPASATAAATGYLQLLAVHPTGRGRGLGRALLGGLESALHEAGATVLTTAARPPRSAWPGADVRYTAFGLLLESAGWQRGGAVATMTVDLDAASRDGLLATSTDLARLAVAGIDIRAGDVADLPALAGLADRLGSSWAAAAALAVRGDPGGLQVALRGSRIVGLACHGVPRPGWVGPVGVDSDERRAGLAAVLLRRCLVEIRAQGRARAEIACDGPVGFPARAVGAYLDRSYTVHTRSG